MSRFGIFVVFKQNYVNKIYVNHLYKYLKMNPKL